MGVCEGWVLMLVFPPFPMIYSWIVADRCLARAWNPCSGFMAAGTEHTGCADERISYREIEWLAQSHAINLCHFLITCNHHLHLPCGSASSSLPWEMCAETLHPPISFLEAKSPTDHLYLAKSDAVANAQSGFLAGFVCLAIKALQ